MQELQDEHLGTDLEVRHQEAKLHEACYEGARSLKETVLKAGLQGATRVLLGPHLRSNG